MRSVDATIPPFIADGSFASDPHLQLAQENAVRALAALEAESGPAANAVSAFLIRTESIASSKIEHIDASTEDFARALAGIRSNPSATAMVSASRAVTGIIDDAGNRESISLDAILDAHRVLMLDDPAESPHAGAVRTQQNWIGGSDFSPIGALHVPPAPERVGPLLADLIEYVNRDDVPVLVQCALAHAQFESIHPFTDGNGHIGRALIGAILRRRGMTTNTTPPIASALAAEQDRYFGMLTRYRRGEAAAIVGGLAEATQIAAEEATASARVIRALPAEWRAAVAPRSGSAAEALLDMILERPVFDMDTVEANLVRPSTTIYDAVARLEKASIIHPITERVRNRVWAVTAVLDELGALDRRISARVRDARAAA